MCSRFHCIEKDCENIVGCCSMSSLDLLEIRKKEYPTEDKYHNSRSLLCVDCVFKRIFNEVYTASNTGELIFERNESADDDHDVIDSFIDHLLQYYKDPNYAKEVLEKKLGKKLDVKIQNKLREVENSEITKERDELKKFFEGLTAIKLPFRLPGVEQPLQLECLVSLKAAEQIKQISDSIEALRKKQEDHESTKNDSSV